MTSKPTKPGAKRRRKTSHEDVRPGAAGPGEPFDPARDEPAADEPGSSPQFIPSPGVPMSQERYDWLKEKAKRVDKPRSTPSQEDPSGKRER